MAAGIAFGLINLTAMVVVVGVIMYSFYSIKTVHGDVTTLASETSVKFDDVDVNSQKLKSNIDTDHQQKIAAMKAAIDTTHKTDLTKVTTDLDTSHKAMMASMQTDYNQQFATTKADYTSQFDTMHKDYTNQFAETKADYTGQFGKATQRFDGIDTRLNKSFSDIDNQFQSTNTRMDKGLLDANTKIASTNDIMNSSFKKVDNKFASVDSAFNTLSSDFTTFSTKTFPTSQDKLKNDLITLQQSTASKLQSDMKTAQDQTNQVISSMSQKMSDKFAAIDLIDAKQDTLDIGMKQQIADAKQTLQSQIDTTAKRLDDQVKIYNDLSKQLSASIGSDSTAFNDIRDSIKQVSNNITALQSQLNSQNTDLSSLKGSYNQFAASVTGQTQAFQTNIDSLKGSLADQKNSIDTLGKSQIAQADQVKAQIVDLQQKIIALTPNTTGQAQIQQISSAQLQDLQNKLTTYQNQIGTTIATQDGTIKSLTTQLNTLQAATTTLSNTNQGQLATMQQDLNGAKASITQQTTNFNTLLTTQNNQLQTLTNQVSALSNSVGSNGSTLTPAQLATLQSAQAAITDMTNRVVALETSTKALDGRITTLSTKVDGIVTKLSTLPTTFAKDYSSGGTMSGDLGVNNLRVNSTAQVTGPFKVDGELSGAGFDKLKSDIASSASIGLDPKINSISRKDDGDWLRITGTTANGTALYQGLSINEGGGLAVGAWEKTNPGEVRIKMSTGNYTHLGYPDGKNYFRGNNAVFDSPITVNNSISGPGVDKLKTDILASVPKAPQASADFSSGGTMKGDLGVAGNINVGGSFSGTGVDKLKTDILASFPKAPQPSADFSSGGTMKGDLGITGNINVGGSFSGAGVDALKANISASVPKVTEYNKGGTMTGNLSVTGDTTVNGNLKTGELSMGTNIISGTGRMHLANQEAMFLLPKNGVQITKDWGASGALNVAGDTSIAGTLNANNIVVQGTLSGPAIQKLATSGVAGPIGPQGPAGPQGGKGDQGIPGAKGDQGATGATGAKGDKGDQGATGAAGAAGAKGDKGDQGVAGSSASVGGSTPISFNNDGKGVIRWGNDFSKIYDDGHLHINTDDNMYISAPSYLEITSANTKFNGQLSGSGIDALKANITASVPKATEYNQGGTMNGNLSVTGDTTVGGNLVLDGTNKWILHTPDDGRKQMYIAPTNAANNNWDWDKQSRFEADGSFFSSKVSTGGLNVTGLITNGQLQMGGNGGNNMKSTGDMVLSSENLMYLLPKGGVKITKDWGAQGTLAVAGDTSIGGNLTGPGIDNVKNDILNTGKDAKFNSISPGGTDWLRITGTANGTALYNGLSIADGGGLFVGPANTWQKAAIGELRVQNKDTTLTSFNHPDGYNVIRGPATYIESPVEFRKPVNLVSGQKLCIGGTCIDETHLQMLTGGRDVAFKKPETNYALSMDNSGNYQKSANYGCSGGGCFENYRLIKK